MIAAFTVVASLVNPRTTVEFELKAVTANSVGVPGRRALTKPFIAVCIVDSSLLSIDPETSITRTISSPHDSLRGGLGTGVGDGVRVGLDVGPTNAVEVPVGPEAEMATRAASIKMAAAARRGPVRPRTSRAVVPLRCVFTMKSLPWGPLFDLGPPPNRPRR